MPFIIQYLLKLSIALGMVHIFYALFLRRLTFYNWNRWYLLGYSLLSFVISFINISPLLEKSDWGHKEVVQIIPMVGNYITEKEMAQDQRWFTWDHLLLVLLAGMLIICLRLLVQFFSYRRLRRSASLLVQDKLKIYHVDGKILPFSFGNSIFINQHQHGEEELKEIIRHEFVHVKQRHTADILFAEFLCMLNWYNPFAWLIRRSIRQNLEFIADHQVLANGINRKQYQYLLLKVTGMSQFSITSNFNLSSLKKRIVMMNKIKSARVQIIRFLFLLPLGAALLLSFRSNRQLPPVMWSLYDLAIADTIPVSDIERVEVNNKKVRITLKDGTEKFYDLENAADRARYEKEIGKLPAPPVPPAPVTPAEPPAEPGIPAPPPAPPAPPAPSVRKKGSSVKVTPAPAKEAIEAVPAKPEPGTTPKPVVHVNVSAEPRPVVIVDGKESTINSISPEAIEKVEVFKDSAAIARYGQRGAHGVVLITTRAVKVMSDVKVVSDVKPVIKDTIIKAD